MSDEYTESIEAPEVPDTVAEVIDLFNGGEKADAEAPSYHTILEVWTATLAPAAAEAKKPVSPQWAGKMVRTYPELTFADCLGLRDRYFAKLAQLIDVLEMEVDNHPGCLTHTTPEDDVEENGDVYRAILLTWQQLFLQWELEWECNHISAPVEFAAIAETHQTIWGSPERTGLTAFLDNIGFQYTEDDQELLSQLLTEQRDAFIEKVVNGE